MLGNFILNQKLVLIVEDSPAQQLVLSALVEKVNLQAIIVSNGQAALDALEHSTFALILMDWRLPDMDGLECTKRIRQKENGTAKRVPIIAVTACSMQGDKERCLNAGMNDYLSKPFTIEQFIEKLDAWLNHEEKVEINCQIKQ